MANGKTSLDKEGCEFGRQIKNELKHNKEDISDVSKDIKEIKNILNDMKKKQSQNDFYNDMTQSGIKWTIRAVIVGMISFVGYLVVRLGNYIDKIFT